MQGNFVNASHNYVFTTTTTFGDPILASPYIKRVPKPWSREHDNPDKNNQKNTTGQRKNGESLQAQQPSDGHQTRHT